MNSVGIDIYSGMGGWGFKITKHGETLESGFRLNYLDAVHAATEAARRYLSR